MEATLLGFIAELHGFKPVLLDYAGQSPCDYFDMQPLTRADSWVWEGDVIHELIARAEYFCGIDSGPGHIAGATNTESYVLWTGHHPVFCMDPAPNVTHLVPSQEYLDGLHDDFMENYQHEFYGEDLETYLCGCCENLLRSVNTEETIFTRED